MSGFKIVDFASYGEHIHFKCSVCGGGGHSKNIAPLGCRSIFTDKVCSCQTYNDWQPVRPDNADELERQQKLEEAKDAFIKSQVRSITELATIFDNANPD